MSDNSQQAGGGIGCLSVLGIVFITLKLTHNIDWSWTWVLAPFWIPIALVAAICAIVVAVAVARA